MPPSIFVVPPSLFHIPYESFELIFPPIIFAIALSAVTTAGYTPSPLLLIFAFPLISNVPKLLIAFVCSDVIVPPVIIIFPAL